MIAGILTVVFFLFPGLTLCRMFRLDTSLPVSVGVSLAYWIIGFWMTSIIPVPLHIFVDFSLIVSVVLLAIDFIQRPAAYNKRTLSSLAGEISMYLLFAVPIAMRTLGQIAPTGQDMSMHTYLAAAIGMADGFIHTLRPLVPLDRFGIYPIGFPVLIAGLSSISRLPVRESAVIVTALTYWLFTASLFAALRKFFSVPVSLFTAVAVTWTGTVPTNIIDWGANPTVLSLDFIILAVLAVADRHRFTVFRTALFLFTAALTHYMIPAAVLYSAVLCCPAALFFWKRRRLSVRWTEIIVLIALAVPFLIKLSSYRFAVSSRVMQYVAGLQRADLFISDHAGFEQVAGSSVAFILSSFSGPVLILYVVSLMALALKQPRKLLVHVLFFTGMLLMTVNSRYWVLPLSPLLYPDRIIILMLVPLSFGIAEGMTIILTWAYKEFVIPAPRNAALFSLIVFGSLFVWLYPSAAIVYRRFLATRNEDVVTKNDLAVFAWLATHTKQTDIVMNNYNDAGIWIPAIARRPITLYHTNPIDQDSLELHTAPPAYAYIGAKSLTRNGSDPVQETIARNPEHFVEVFRSGTAVLYRITASR